MMPLERLITGGQTGADLGALKAAKAHGMATGGMIPLGYLTEDGPRPEFAELYGLVEMPTADYKARTEQNVRDADAVLWFGDTGSSGGKATLWACKGMGRPYLVVEPGKGVRPSEVAEWIGRRGFKTLMVAGNRESKAPGIGIKVERFVGEVLRGMKE